MNGKNYSSALSWAIFCTLLGGMVACSSNSSDDSGNRNQLSGEAANLAEGWQSINVTANFAQTKLDSLGHFETSRNACGHEAYGTMDITLWNDMVSLTNRAITLAPLDERNMLCFARSDGKFDGTANLSLIAPQHTAMELTSAIAPTPTPTPTTPTPHPHPTPIPIPTPVPTPHPSVSPSPSPSASPSEGPKRALFEIRGGDVCTTIKDQQLAQQLYMRINTFVDLADKADCANGYGH